MFLTNLIAWFHAELAKLVSLFHHHAAAGTMPDASLPTVAPTGKELPAAPPVSPPVAPSLPEWTNGMSQPDARGFVKLQAIEEKRATDMRWLHAAPYYAIKDILTTFTLTPEQKVNVGANLNSSMMLLSGGFFPGKPDQANAVLDGTHLNVAYPYVEGPNGPTTNNAASYPDVLSFEGDNPADGYVGPSVNDIARFITTCESTGNFPVILPTTPHGDIPGAH